MKKVLKTLLVIGLIFGMGTYASAATSQNLELTYNVVAPATAITLSSNAETLGSDVALGDTATGVNLTGVTYGYTAPAAGGATISAKMSAALATGMSYTITGTGLTQRTLTASDLSLISVAQALNAVSGQDMTINVKADNTATPGNGLTATVVFTIADS